MEICKVCSITFVAFVLIPIPVQVVVNKEWVYYGSVAKVGFPFADKVIVSPN